VATNAGLKACATQKLSSFDYKKAATSPPL